MANFHAAWNLTPLLQFGQFQPVRLLPQLRAGQPRLPSLRPSRSSRWSRWSRSGAEPIRRDGPSRPRCDPSGCYSLLRQLQNLPRHRRFHRNRPTCFAKIGAILVGRHRRCRRFNEVLQLPLFTTLLHRFYRTVTTHRGVFGTLWASRRKGNPNSRPAKAQASEMNDEKRTGAGGGTRTLTYSRTADFESAAAAITPLRQKWSGRRESNPRNRLGRPTLCH